MIRRRGLFAVVSVFGWVLACSSDDGVLSRGDLAPAIDKNHLPPHEGEPVLNELLDSGTKGEPHGTSPAFQPDLGPPVVQLDAPPPIYGGTLAVMRGGNLVVASDPDRDVVHLVDMTSKEVRDVYTGAHALPFRVVEDASRRAHVTLRGTGELLTIDLISGQIVGRRWVCAEPRGLAYEPQNDDVWVACDGGALVEMGANGGSARRTLHLGRGLRDVVVVNDGMIVSKFRQATVTHVGWDGTIGPELAPQPINGVQPEVAWRTVANPTGGVTMLHQRASNQVINIELAAQPTQGAYGGCGVAGVLDSTLTTFAPNAPVKPRPGLVQMVVPVDFAFASDGVTALVVSPGNSHTKALVSYGFFGPKEQPPEPCGWGGGLPPTPNAPPPDPIAPDFNQYEYVAAAFDGVGHAILQSREPAALVVLNEARPHAVVMKIPLSDVSREDTGHLLFHSNSGGFLACASCHPEGGDDGHVWKFANGAVVSRRTPSLRGTVSGTAPYHWEGNLPSVAALLDDTFTQRMGGPHLDPPTKNAVQHWVESIPAPIAEPVSDSAAVMRGAQIFASAKCSSCHTGAHFTNNKTLSVGTGQSLQVPPLIGVSARAPFLHNGCASTLEGRFRLPPPKQGLSACGGGDQHGITSSLSPDQIDDLIAYLNGL